MAQSLAGAVLDYKAEEVASPASASISTSAAHAPWGVRRWRSRGSTGPPTIRFDPYSPTQLDKIKNFRDQVQPGVVVEAPLLPRPQGLELPEALAATVRVSDEVGLAERSASSFRCVSGSSTATAASRASRVRGLVDAL